MATPQQMFGLHKERRKIIVLFEDVDVQWDWDEDDLIRLEQMSQEGKNIWQMCDALEIENPDDVYLALFYLSMKGKQVCLDIRKLYGKIVDFTALEYVEQRAKGMTDEELIKELQTNELGLNIWKVRNNFPTRKTKIILNEEVYRIYKQWKYSDRKIAKKLNLSFAAIKDWKKKNKISARRLAK